MSHGQTIGDNIEPPIVGIVIAHIGDGEGESRGNEVDGVHHSQGQQKPTVLVKGVNPWMYILTKAHGGIKGTVRKTIFVLKEG